MNTCPECKNLFVQPFCCTTCGAQKLYDHTVTSQAQIIEWQRTEIERLRAAVERWAQECSECDGSGVRWSGHVENPDLSPCPDCADIRAVLAQEVPR